MCVIMSDPDPDPDAAPDPNPDPDTAPDDGLLLGADEVTVLPVYCMHAFVQGTIPSLCEKTWVSTTHCDVLHACKKQLHCKS